MFLFHEVTKFYAPSRHKIVSPRARILALEFVPYISEICLKFAFLQNRKTFYIDTGCKEMVVQSLFPYILEGVLKVGASLLCQFLILNTLESDFIILTHFFFFFFFVLLVLLWLYLKFSSGTKNAACYTKLLSF